MSVCSFLARLAMKAAAVAVFGWVGSSLSAADVYAPPPVAAPVAVAPGVPGMPGCETCQHGAPRASCHTCGNKFLPLSLKHKDKGPYPVTLCPGACFGYFQTQWRKWDEVCPYPYLGTGVGDAPKPPTPVVNVPRTGGELNPPRPLDPKLGDPKMKEPKKTELPAIPPVPNKFDP